MCSALSDQGFSTEHQQGHPGGVHSYCTARDMQLFRALVALEVVEAMHSSSDLAGSVGFLAFAGLAASPVPDRAICDQGRQGGCKCSEGRTTASFASTSAVEAVLLSSCGCATVQNAVDGRCAGMTARLMHGPKQPPSCLARSKLPRDSLCC